MEFKPEYVRCTWSPELEGKEVCYSDSIDELWREVTSSKDNRTHCEKGRSTDYPFKCGIQKFRFVYYDPNYSLKIAHEQGQKIECKKKGDVWKDWDYIPAPEWLEDYEYRIMQEEEENPVTHRELARWLAQGNGEWRWYNVGDVTPYAQIDFRYSVEEGFHPVKRLVLVRKWEDSEWHEPTREYMGLEE